MLAQINSKERLQQELLERDVIIAALRQQLNVLSSSFVRDEPCAAVVRSTNDEDKEKGKEKRTGGKRRRRSSIVEILWHGWAKFVHKLSHRTRSTNDEEDGNSLMIIHTRRELYESLSLWRSPRTEQTVPEGLSDDDCFIVFGCAREMVPRLRLDVYEERLRRWQPLTNQM